MDSALEVQVHLKLQQGKRSSCYDISTGPTAEGRQAERRRSSKGSALKGVHVVVQIRDIEAGTNMTSGIISSHESSDVNANMSTVPLSDNAHNSTDEPPTSAQTVEALAGAASSRDGVRSVSASPLSDAEENTGVERKVELATSLVNGRWNTDQGDAAGYPRKPVMVWDLSLQKESAPCDDALVAYEVELEALAHFRDNVDMHSQGSIELIMTGYEALLPAFANEQLRDLQASIQQLHLQLSASHRELFRQEERISMMNDNMNVSLLDHLRAATSSGYGETPKQFDHICPQCWQCVRNSTGVPRSCTKISCSACQAAAKSMLTVCRQH